MRCPGSLGSSRSSRRISSLNGSSFEPAGARSYFGGLSLLIALRIVSRCSPVRRWISRCVRPRTKCSRRTSAHCSTPTTSVLPSSLCANEPRQPGPPDAQVAHISTGAGGPVFTRRRHCKWPGLSRQRRRLPKVLRRPRRETYAVRRTVPPSAEIEAQIDQLLAVGVGENPRESLSELAKLGARLIIQRAVEDEFDAWLGRARYERRPDCQRGLRNFDSGLRNGYRPRRVQTAEGELEVEIPQVREAAEPFVSALFPHSTKLLRTRPLEAMVVGAFVRGLSMRDVESLCEEAGLGKLSKSTASRICTELRNASRRSSAVTSTRSGWWRCSSMRSFSTSGRRARRRACFAPGGLPRRASGSWSGSASGCASRTRTGSPWHGT